MAKLTAMQEAFVLHLLADPERNATKAAVAAGCKQKSASVTASKWLRSAKVQDEISRRTEKVTSKLELTAERVLQEIARLAFVDPRRLFNPDGSALPVTDLDDDTAAALAGIEIEEVFGAGPLGPKTGYTKKFKLSNKVEALNLAGRYFKLFTDKIQHENLSGHVSQLSDEALEEILKAVQHGKSDRKPRAKKSRAKGRRKSARRG